MIVSGCVNGTHDSHFQGAFLVYPAPLLCQRTAKEGGKKATSWNLIKIPHWLDLRTTSAPKVERPALYNRENGWHHSWNSCVCVCLRGVVLWTWHMLHRRGSAFQEPKHGHEWWLSQITHTHIVYTPLCIHAHCRHAHKLSTHTHTHCSACTVILKPWVRVIGKSICLAFSSN